MRDHILILGGYGNFGKRIALALAKANIPITIAGRDRAKAGNLAATLGPIADISVFDVNKELERHLTKHRPRIVINTCGPFQTADYRIARSCIRHRVHYIDLADGREFVTGIVSLQDHARKNNAVIISGASTVPGLSSAVLDYYQPQFSEMTSLKFGVSPGQKAERGYATTKGIMTYIGKPLAPHPSPDGALDGAPDGTPNGSTYGWQNIYRQKYPVLGKRWMANCEVPDLDLLPAVYGLKSIRFSAGMELGFLHLGLWALSGLVKTGATLGLSLDLAKHAATLLWMSNLFNVFGTDNGGMHMLIRGKDSHGRPLERKWFIIAKSGDGPQIPTIPAIVLAKKLWAGEKVRPGAYPCVGLITLDEYLDELKEFDITTFEN